MDNPVAEIEGVVLQLTTGTWIQQQQTLGQYFTKDASFTHPFCSVRGDRAKILCIYQWYKMLSPHISIAVKSVAFDEENQLLYVNINQIFKIRFVPLYRANVNLTTVLQLIYGQSLDDPQESQQALSRPQEHYYIKSQNDLYQVDQFIKFVLPWSIGANVVQLWHWLSTLFIVMGAILLGPLHLFYTDLSQIIGFRGPPAERQISNGEAPMEERTRDSVQPPAQTQTSNGEATADEKRRDSKKTDGSNHMVRKDQGIRQQERHSNGGTAHWRPYDPLTAEHPMLDLNGDLGL